MFRRISLHLSSERFNTRASHIQCCPRQPRDSFSLLEPPAKRVRNATSLALEDDSLGCVSVNGHDNFAGWPRRNQTISPRTYMFVARQGNWLKSQRPSGELSLKHLQSRCNGIATALH